MSDQDPEHEEEVAAGWRFTFRRWPKGAPMTETPYLATYWNKGKMILAAMDYLKFNTSTRDEIFDITPADTEILVRYGLEPNEIHDMTLGPHYRPKK